jgi:hypothetical protein
MKATTSLYYLIKNYFYNNGGKWEDLLIFIFWKQAKPETGDRVRA